MSASQELTVDAAVSGDRDAAFAAMLLDPLTSRLDYDDIAVMTDEMLDATAEWLPQFSKLSSARVTDRRVGSAAPVPRDCPPASEGERGGAGAEGVLGRGPGGARPRRVGRRHRSARGPRASCSRGPNRLVHALRARGVQPFDPVATLTRNSAELFQVLLAVFQGGWQYVPLNTHLTAAELAYILGDSGATALFADADLAAVAAGGRGRGGRPAGRSDRDRW